MTLWENKRAFIEAAVGMQRYRFNFLSLGVFYKAKCMQGLSLFTSATSCKRVVQ